MHPFLRAAQCRFRQRLLARQLSPFDLQWRVGRVALSLGLVPMFSPFDLQWRCLGLIRGPAFLIAVFAV
jgi:hypothetical protein